jgi:hypothetical protein
MIMETEKKIAEKEAPEFSFSKVGFYMTNGTLVPVDRDTHERFSMLMQAEIALMNSKHQPK